MRKYNANYKQTSMSVKLEPIEAQNTTRAHEDEWRQIDVIRHLRWMKTNREKQRDIQRYTERNGEIER